MSGIYSDWTKCRYCMYEALLDRAVCVLNYEPCERESCHMIRNDWKEIRILKKIQNNEYDDEVNDDCNTFNGETTESYGTFECCDMLNQLNDENKQLKHFKEKVFNLIDEKLKENEEENNHVDTATYYANKQTLNKLKKELQKK